MFLLCGSQVHVIEKAVEIPQPQIVQQHVEVPEILTRELWQQARRPRSIPRVRLKG